MANGWERLLETVMANPSAPVGEPDDKKPEVPEETPQGDSAVIQVAPKAKRTRKTKPKEEQQDEQDV